MSTPDEQLKPVDEPKPIDQLKPSEDLRPGAGRPLVEGPPDSVAEPVPDRTINRAAGISGLVLLGVAGIVTLIVLVLIVFAILGNIR
jgi:hypothetical protein